MCVEAAWARLVRNVRGLRRCARGAVAVEFAFVFPLLILLVVGVFSVGALMHSITNVRHALEETARMLQMDPDMTESELQTALNGKLAVYGDSAVTLSMTVQTDAFGSSIAHLSASYPYTVAIPFIPKYEGAYQQTAEVFLVISP